jgi:hypothetical protein
MIASARMPSNGRVFNRRRPQGSRALIVDGRREETAPANGDTVVATALDLGQ